MSFADAIIYATARHTHAELITADDHFENLPNVRYFFEKAHLNQLSWQLSLLAITADDYLPSTIYALSAYQ